MIQSITSGLANENVSTSGADLLNIRIQGRPFGMAGAFTAVANDVNALYYNPAGIVSLNTIEGSVMYSQGIDDMFYGSAAFIFPFSQANGLGIQFNLLHQGRMDVFHPEGTIEDLDLGNSFVLGLSYGHILFGEHTSFGLTGKLFKSSLGSYSATSAAVDLGVLVNFSRFSSQKNNISLGLSVLNLGPGIKYINEKDALPLTFKLGAAYVYHFRYLSSDYQLILSHDFLTSSEYDALGMNTGMELSFRRTIFLRAGYQFRGDFTLDDNNGFTSGIGVRVKNFQFDYGFKLSGSEIQKYDHCFSLTFAFGKGDETYSLNKQSTVQRSFQYNAVNNNNVQAIKYNEIEEINKEIIFGKDNVNISKNWVIEYSTNVRPDQSFDSMDYIEEKPKKGQIKWVRWKLRNENVSEDQVIFYRISIE